MANPRVIRTFSMLGADGAGKTALVEALLRVADAKRAAPDGSTARLDAEPEEKKRNFTLSLHPESFEEDGRSFHVLDCPGFAAFLTEVEWALQVTDGAILAISAADGAHNRAERTYDVLAESGRPAFAVITRLDHEQADFHEALEDIESSLKVKAIPLQLPVFGPERVKGLADLVSMKLHAWDGKGFGQWTEAEIPAEAREEAERLRTAMVEAAAESDDELLGKYLDGAPLAEEEILRGLAAGAAAQRFLPVACAGAKSGVGVRELLDLAVRILPGPEARAVKGRDPAGKETVRSAAPDAPFSGQVFKTTIDHFAGRIDYLRVFSGTLRADATVVNPRTRTEERIGHLYRTDGAQTVEVNEAEPGDFVVLVKLKDAHTGDTLCDRDVPLALPPFAQHVRPVSYAVHAKAGDDKAAAALQKIIEEDPSLELTRSTETGEMLLQGMGQAHLDVTVERAKRKHGVEITLTPPSPAYLETITAAAKAQGKFKRQTGGHGQYGDAHVELQPRARGEGFEFEDAIVGGVIPRQFIPSVEKGIRGALSSGPLAGYPVVDFRARLVFGSYHDVDSSDMAFQVAGSMAFKKAVLEARPILLEPIMKLEVRVPEEYVGAVMGDLNSRRAKVQGLEPLARGVLIRATCPHAEAMSYDADLRSLTQGVGYFTMEPSHHDPVPPHIAQKIIEKRRAEGKVKGVEEEK
ncbi:small GTP-binding protein [Anaeromyxobacter dehalogenans 2CP-1]|uniref:Elongation factor G n=1 Tax=Anaeromyxobacter dehalogenans (strain ATCC BAA-258 / DSM 21875 / 2CP-1) TaxID=455488 RepID=B8JE71_ANAD2|nr:elongation factor G [Anaeromyxobacter dehalogenans]ACL66136.1 small GTP-binding protein [Anaeromyxobacter dehalogenans 2CP-1]